MISSPQPRACAQRLNLPIYIYIYRGPVIGSLYKRERGGSVSERERREERA